MGEPKAQNLKFSFGGGFAGGHKVQTRDPRAHTMVDTNF